MLSGIPSNVASDIAASVLLSLVGGVLVAVSRQFRGLGRMVRDWNGEPGRPGFPPRRGVPERLENVEGQFKEVMDHLGRQDTMLTTIKHEIEYNSGSSIKDAVHRTDDAMARLSEDLGAIKKCLEVK